MKYKAVLVQDTGETRWWRLVDEADNVLMDRVQHMAYCAEDDLPTVDDIRQWLEILQKQPSHVPPPMRERTSVLPKGYVAAEYDA